MLGLHTISERHIADFVAESKNASSEQKPANEFEVEDDEKLKAELESVMSENEVNLDDWNICEAESEKENMQTVCIRHKKTGMFVSIDLEKSDTLYTRLFFVLKNMARANSGVAGKNKFFELSASNIGDTVHFGELDWLVARKEESGVLLICATMVGDTRSFNQNWFNEERLPNSYEWLNGEFLENHFSETERSLLIARAYAYYRKTRFDGRKDIFEGTIFKRVDPSAANGLSAKVFLPPEDDVFSLSKEKLVRGIEWWLESGTQCINSDGYLEHCSNGYVVAKGIVPAIMVSLAT